MRVAARLPPLILAVAARCRGRPVTGSLESAGTAGTCPSERPVTVIIVAALERELVARSYRSTGHSGGEDHVLAPGDPVTFSVAIANGSSPSSPTSRPADSTRCRADICPADGAYLRRPDLGGRMTYRTSAARRTRSPSRRCSPCPGTGHWS